jgi:hypothetical protein
MAASTGPVLLAGGVTIATNQVINAEPWSQALPVIVMTGVASLLLAGAEHLSRELAIGIAWIALVTRIFVVKDKHGRSPADEFLAWYNAKGSNK